ncbi:MAG TPA: hypothetical protein ENF88_00660 [Candidatus Acetothermia bacterium]|nr:hypothetical protein [Candidatus Acetothermia bacterium]HEX32185.1 hypothetical protein [Candidatus Acetothermia bacterium]
MEGGREKAGGLEQIRREIEWRLTLGVLSGMMDESVAEVWKRALDELKDGDLHDLIRSTRGLSDGESWRATIRFIMSRNYPFREFILYETDDEFKRRLGIRDGEVF